MARELEHLDRMGELKGLRRVVWMLDAYSGLPTAGPVAAVPEDVARAIDARTSGLPVLRTFGNGTVDLRSGFAVLVDAPEPTPPSPQADRAPAPPPFPSNFRWPIGRALRNRELAVVLMCVGWWPDVGESLGLVRLGDVIDKMEQTVKAGRQKVSQLRSREDFERSGIPARRGRNANTKTATSKRAP